MPIIIQHAARRPSPTGAWTTAVVVLVAGLVGPDVVTPTSSAGSEASRTLIAVSGGEVVDSDGYRYHAFRHDPRDTFQGHPGGDGCSSSCGGTNHGGGGGGGYGSPGAAGTGLAGGDGGDGFRADLLPIEVRDALADAGHEVGQVVEVGGLDRVWFAGGGGGGTFFQDSSGWLSAGNSSEGTVGEGGRGGGGAGAPGDPDGISQGGHALPNTGGGGGGSGSSRTAAGATAAADGAPEGKGRGGDGGSGIVLVRWPRAQAPDLAPSGAVIHDHATDRYAVFLHSPADGDRSTFTLANPTDLDVEYLVVGGGGGGGGETFDDYGSGGGGAGGVVSTLGRPVVLAAGAHVIEVGAGGRGGDGVAAANQVGAVGEDGHPSVLGDVAHARGGGGGAARRLPAGSGASGGGGTSQAAGTPGSGSTGTTSATLEVTGGTVDVDVLVIAGGGSGGAGAAGGGGAGGVEWNVPSSGTPVDADGARFAPLPLTGTYAVEVGAGGRPVTTPDTASLYAVGKDGSPSTFAAGTGPLPASIVAAGGGGGGRRPDVVDADDGRAPDGRDGGSGGGAGRPATSSAALGAAGQGGSTLGNDGGTGRGGSARFAGGGGGAGSAGGVSARAGANESTGGDGTPLFDAFLAPFDIGEQHEDVRYAAAGGGGLGGLGGIGDGGDGTSSAAPTSAASGAPGTGSGGGALGAFTRSSGAGGSGVVIVRYAIPVWQQDADLGSIRIGDPLSITALIGASDTAAPIELLDGTLPTGLTVDGAGLSGTASTAGTFTFTLRAFDRDGDGAAVAVDREFTVDVFDTLIVEEPFDEMPTSGWILSGGGGWTPTVENETFGGAPRGALRVTPALTSRSGFALYDVPQQARAGLDVTFWASVWQPSSTVGADGLVFFLKRGDDPGTEPGAFGSRLGYGTGGSTPGISGALLGVGLDTFGGYRRFSINGSPEPFTCPTIDEVGQTLPGTTSSANNLSVRGPGQGLDGYCLLAPSVTISPGWGRSGTVAAGGTRTREAGARQIRVRYDYDPGDGGATAPSGIVRVWVDDVADDDTPKVTLDAPQELLDAETFKFGFSGATGGQVNNQEVWDVVVRSVNPLSPLTWIEDGLAAARVGQPYAADLDAKATGGVRPYSFSLVGGELPPGLDLNSPLQGTPTVPGTYTFDIAATGARGGPSATETFTLTVEDGQVIDLMVADQSLAVGTVTVEPVSRSVTSEEATGLTVTVVSRTTGVCTVDGLEVTLVAAGTCELEASQSGGTVDGITFAAAEEVVVTFEVVPGPVSTAPTCSLLDANDPGYCDGTLDRPFLVATAGNLIWVADRTDDAATLGSVGERFLQVADIDLSEVEDWTPIGTTSRGFGGVYDGQFHEIRGLSIAATGEGPHGLFGRILSDATEEATVRNLKLVDVDVSVAATSGPLRVGALAGRAGASDASHRTVLIEQVSVTGTVGATVSGSTEFYVAGIVGQAEYNARLDNLISFRGDIVLDVTGLSGTSRRTNVGGLVGRTSFNSEVSLAYAQLDITITGQMPLAWQLDAGLTVGSSSTNASTLTEMYGTGSLTGDGTRVNFGAVGYVESSSDSVVEVYHPSDADVPSFGRREGSQALDFRPRPSESMRGASAATTMTGAHGRWDFDAVWVTVTDPEDDFPVFYWETLAGGTTAPDGPRELAAEDALDDRVTLTWRRPEPDGGSARITYTVTASDGSLDLSACTRTSEAEQLACGVEGLTAGETTFTVTPSNAAGPGPSASVAVTRQAQAAVSVDLTTTVAVYGDVLPVTPSGGSGSGAFSVTVAGDACVLDGGDLRIMAASGGCTVTVTRAGDATFLARTSDPQPIAVGARPLTVADVALAPRPYDGTRDVEVSTAGVAIEGVLEGDDVTLSAPATGVAESADVGIHEVDAVITLAGDDAGNYVLPVPPTLTVEITPRPLTVAGASVASRAYDGTTAVSITGARLVNTVPGDVVSLANASSGVAASRDVGTRAVSTSMTLTGADASNYVLSAQPSLSVTITPRPASVTLGAVPSRVYDGTNTVPVPAGSITVSGLVAGESIVASGTATIPFRDVGTRVLTLDPTYTAGAGTTLTNYTLPATLTGTVTITPRPVSVVGLRALGRPWDGTTTAVLDGATLQGVVTGDRVSLSGVSFGTFAASAPGTHTVTTDVTLTGDDARNYRLAPIAPLSATISRAPATLRITGGLTQFADGSPRSVRAAVTPTDAGRVAITYPGGSAPTAPGSYPIVVRLDSPTHQAPELRTTLTIQPIDALVGTTTTADPDADPAVVEARREEMLARIAVRPDGTLALPEIGPVLEADGTAPAFAPREHRVLEDGEPALARVVVIEEQRVRVETEDRSLTLELQAAITTPDGRRPLPVDTDGTLLLDRGGFVEVGGSGFLAGSTAEVWMFSEATFLGTAIVGPDGTFDGAFPVDDLLAPGEHTIQLNGTGADQRVRSTSLGVRITDEPAATAPPEADERVTIITALTDTPLGGRGPVALLLLAAALGAIVMRWWIIGRRRSDDGAEEDLDRAARTRSR